MSDFYQALAIAVFAALFSILGGIVVATVTDWRRLRSEERKERRERRRVVGNLAITAVCDAVGRANVRLNRALLEPDKPVERISDQESMTNEVRSIVHRLRLYTLIDAPECQPALTKLEDAIREGLRHSDKRIDVGERRFLDTSGSAEHAKANQETDAINARIEDELHRFFTKVIAN
ncbi:MAG: hypothetical protein AAGF47_11040 [Planctomycetota bacterium]